MLLILFYGFLTNAIVLILGVAYYKLRNKKTNFAPLLIVNFVVSILAFIYGITAGFFTYIDPYIVQTVGMMSPGMAILCIVPFLFYLKQIRK